MGWFSKIAKGIKGIFSKVTKVVKKIVKSIGGTAKKVWNGVKKFGKKVSKKISKLGPLASIAIGFIPGFQSLWAGAGVWGQVAKKAIAGYIGSGGNPKGALLGAVTGGIGDIFGKMPGGTLSEKIGNWWEGWTNSSEIGKAFGQQTGIANSKYAPWTAVDKHMATEYAAPSSYNPIMGTRPEDLPPAYGDPKYEDVSLTGYDAREPGGFAPSLFDKFNPFKPAASAIQGVQPIKAVGGPNILNTDAGYVVGEAGIAHDVNREQTERLGLKSLLAQYKDSLRSEYLLEPTYRA